MLFSSLYLFLFLTTVCYTNAEELSINIKIKYTPCSGSSKPVPQGTLVYVQFWNDNYGEFRDLAGSSERANAEGRFIKTVDFDPEDDKKFRLRLEPSNLEFIIGHSPVTGIIGQFEEYFFFSPIYSTTPSCFGSMPSSWTIPKRYTPGNVDESMKLQMSCKIFELFDLCVKLRGDVERFIFQNQPLNPPLHQVRVAFPYLTTSYGGADRILYVFIEHFNIYKALAHEFGHFIMGELSGHQSIGEGIHGNCHYEQNSPHNPKQSAQINWNEGYANGFAVILGDLAGEGAPGFMIPGGLIPRDYEKYKCPYNVLHNGMTDDEGRIGATLWDLYDGEKEGFINNEWSNPGVDAAEEIELGRPQNGNYANFPLGLGDRNAGVRLSAYNILIAPIINDRFPTVDDYYTKLMQVITNVHGINSAEMNEAKRIFCYNYFRHADCA